MDLFIQHRRNTMSEQTHENPYFDLITTGVGYLNRARTVKPKQGAGYECVSIAALRGHTDSPEYTYFDCRIVGEQALEFVSTYKEAINDRDTKVLVRFNVGDGTAESYEIQSGENKGQRRHLIKGRLLKVTWAKVGDEVIELGQDEDKDSQAMAQQPAMNESQDGPLEEQSLQTSGASDWEASLSESVTLFKKDPDFAVKRDRLNALGYSCTRWDDQHLYWTKAAA
jgi:hypothetical protein